MADHKNTISELNQLFKEVYSYSLDAVFEVPLNEYSISSLKMLAKRGNKEAKIELKKRQTGLYKFLKGDE